MEDSGDLDQEEEDYEEDDSFDHHGVVGVEQSTKQPPTPKTTVTTTSANGESKLATPEKEETSASQSKPLSKEEKRTVAAAVKPSPVKSKPLKGTSLTICFLLKRSQPPIALRRKIKVNDWFESTVYVTATTASCGKVMCSEVRLLTTASA